MTSQVYSKTLSPYIYRRRETNSAVCLQSWFIYSYVDFKLEPLNDRNEQLAGSLVICVINCVYAASAVKTKLKASSEVLRVFFIRHFVASHHRIV